MPRTITIRQSLLRNQIVVILVLSGVIMGTTFLGARRAVRSLSHAIIGGAVAQTEAELRRFFEPVDRGLEVARAWGEAGLLDSGDPERLTALLVPVIEQNPQISSIMVADDRGYELLILHTAERWQMRITRAEEWGGRTRWLEWTDADATPQESLREIDYDPRTRPWFEGALERREGGGVYWTEPYVFFTTKELGMTASIPYDPGDGRGHVVGFDVLLEDISRFTRGIEVSDNGSVSVMTADLRFIALADSPRFWAGEDLLGWQLRRPRELNSPWMDDATNAFASRPLEEAGTPVRFLSGGEIWWGQVRSFPLAADHELLTAVILPNSDLLGDRATIRRSILLVTLLVLTGAVVWAMVLARRFSEPIEALAHESERIRQGNLEPPKETVASRLTEVERLATSQEHMRQGLVALMRLERDLQLARQIQQSTFPERLPTLRGFELEAWSEPAEATGGDTYDVIGYAASNGSRPMAEGRVDGAILLLADATGHGIGPALSVTQIRAMLRMAVRMQADLPRVAAHLNEQLFADLPKNRLITAWLGELDAKRHRLTTFSAGQGPLLVYRAGTGAVEYRNADAPPFGLLASLPSVETPTIELQPGDIYAVLSDGFFEAKAKADPGDELGKERVSAVIAAHRRASASELLDALKQTVAEFTGSAPADDDRTALIIKRTR